MLAQHYFSHKELQGLNGKELVDKLKTQKSILWEDYPEFFRSGVFIKRFNVAVKEDVVRSRVGPHPFIKEPFHNYSHDLRVMAVKDDFLGESDVR